MSKQHQTIPGEPEEAPVQPDARKFGDPIIRRNLKCLKKRPNVNPKKYRRIRFLNRRPNQERRMGRRNVQQGKAACRIAWLLN
jgi:hypothetical protein